jgi:hypothetical protein
MSMTPLALAIHELLALSLFWFALCRSAHADATTSLPIRLSLKLVGLVAVMCIGAPLFGWKPNFVTVALLIGLVAALGVERRVR